MELIKLVANDPIALGKLTSGIANVVAKSYKEDKFRPTDAETKRRFNLCIDVFTMLRKDKAFQWSIERIIAEMPKALRHKLDGTPWDPSKARATWAPGEG